MVQAPIILKPHLQEILFQNMRVLEFSFKFTDKDTGKIIANAILHHAYPKRHSLLFAYDFK